MIILKRRCSQVLSHISQLVLTLLFFLFFQNENEEKKSDPFPDDSFLMVSQVHWEDDVVWNGDDIKHKVSNFLTAVYLFLLPFWFQHNLPIFSP